MRAYYRLGNDARLYVDDCIAVMADLPAESVDAVVCDPPYELGFMGKGWDSAGVAFAPSTWAEALRVLKPGGHLLAFGGTRTFHRITVAIEDAGFEVRDCLSWLYGQGFPKSLDVSKAIDKRRDDRAEVLEVADWLAPLVKKVGAKKVADALGVTSTMVSQHWCSHSQTTVPTLEQVPRILETVGVDAEAVPPRIRRLLLDLNGRKGQPGDAWFLRDVIGTVNGTELAVAPGEGRDRPSVNLAVTAPATDAAREWQGWGTALKPAWEPCVVARKPLSGTVAENVQAHGTGALNIDGCRIGTDYQGPRDDEPSAARRYFDRGSTDFASTPGPRGGSPLGRWPANVALDEQAAAMLDAQSGERAGFSGGGTRGAGFRADYVGGDKHGRMLEAVTYGDTGGASRFFYVAKASKRDRGEGNTHPTVKPTALMRWLVRLVTPPGGIVLDPFAGSGTTLVACRAEGVRCIGIEREQEYAAIIARRMQAAEPDTPTLFDAA